MTETLSLVLALVTGVALGALFFGGLWWTVNRMGSSKRPALLLFGSFLLRTSVALSGFYLIAHGHWERLLACLLGFVIARVIVTLLTRAAEKPNYLEPVARHAP